MSDLYEIQNDPADQFPLEITFQPGPNRVPFNGAVKSGDNGTLWLYWMPQGRNYRDQFDHLVGWYQVPLMEEVEDWTFDSCCPTPCDDELEPDHPDSWLHLLGLV